MIEAKYCVTIQSDMNTWIDFCIVIHSEDVAKAKVVISKAYDDWWELPDAQFEPIADWIGRCLKENEIAFDIYFKEEDK